MIKDIETGTDIGSNIYPLHEQYHRDTLVLTSLFVSDFLSRTTSYFMLKWLKKSEKYYDIFNTKKKKECLHTF